MADAKRKAAIDEDRIGMFGGCPVCGGNDGYVNAGKTHVFYCKEHMVSWIGGANIFSDWLYETKAEQLEKYRFIEGFERVVPLDPPLDPATPETTLKGDPFDEELPF